MCPPRTIYLADHTGIKRSLPRAITLLIDKFTMGHSTLFGQLLTRARDAHQRYVPCFQKMLYTR